MCKPWLVLFLAALAAPVAAQNDPAYVDSPAGRAQADPARADGGSVSDRGASIPATSPAGDQQASMMVAQQQALLQQQQALMAQQEQASMAQQQGPGQNDPYGMPTQQQASPMQQIRSALMQDAVNATDARLQREIMGPGYSIQPAPAPATPPTPAGGW